MDRLGRCADLVVLTKNDAIRSRPLERAALARSSLRVFCLTNANLTNANLTNANLTKAEQVLRFERLWQAVIRRSEQRGPFVGRVYVDRLQDLRF